MKILGENVLKIEDGDKDKYYGFIYITQNNLRNMYYIGQKKFNTQICHETYLGSGKYLMRAINKYGKENFVKFAIAFADTEEELHDLEKFYMLKYDATNSSDFYNIHEGGSGGYTMKGYTDEQKEEYAKNMSIIVKKRYEDPEYTEMIRVKTMEAMTDESLEKRSRIMKERYKDPKMRKKQSVAGKKAWKNPERRKMASARMHKRHKEDPSLKKLSSERWKGENNPKSKGLTEEEIRKLGESRRILRTQFYMCDDEWNTVKQFDGVKEVLQYLNLKGHSDLYKAIRNKTKYKNYRWKKESYKKSQETIENTSKFDGSE